MNFYAFKTRSVLLLSNLVLIAGLSVAAEKPNIVVLLADDHSAADMSVYGASDIPTPHLDAMASRGMVFERAFVNSPSCAPSRAALFTGLYPAKNGAESNHARPLDSIKRLPAYLKELGYEVVSFGKVSHYAHVTEQGFDRAENYGYHEHEGVQASVEFLKSRKSDKPLALFFGTNWPHVPLPQPESVDPVKVRVQPMHIDTPEYRFYRARYINAVIKMDDEIGTVYDAARKYLGEAHTFFLQTADHGAQLPFGKWNLYDEGTRVPLIVQWQGHVQAGVRTMAMAQWIDILPTLVEVGGGQTGDSIDGRSFVPVLEGRTAKHREAIFTTHSNDNDMNVYPCRSMRTEKWKYIRNLHPEFRYTSHIDRAKGEASLEYIRSWEEAAKRDTAAAAILNRYRQRPAEELYDLENDPYELINLASISEHADQLGSMRLGLDKWLKATADKQSVAGNPLLLTEPFSLLQGGKSKSRTLMLDPHINLQSDQAPQISNRPFTATIEIAKLGEGVLAAQGGQANGWALFIRDGELNFVVNRNSQRETLRAKIASAKVIEASIGPKFLGKLHIDGQEVAKKPLSGLLDVQPIDGLQVGRDLAAPVGDYKVPFAFNGQIVTAKLEIGDEIPAPPFVGSVPSGGVVPKMEVEEQQKHPLADRDKYGGFLDVTAKATGNFRFERIHSRWFFITPDGHPYIAIGPNHTGPTIRDQGEKIGLWARFKNDPNVAAMELLKIIQDMGFTAGDVYQHESTYTRKLPWITFFWYGNQNQTFVDVFDARAMADVQRRAYEHARSVADNPWVLGIAGPDLQIWDNKLVRMYRELAPSAAGRQRYVAFLRERYASDISKYNGVYKTSYASFDDLDKLEKIVYYTDIEDDKIDAWTLRWRLPVAPEQSTNPEMQRDNDAFCAMIASTLFPQLREAVKRGAPNHLFLGEHLAVRMIPDAVISAMAPHIDGYLAQAVEVSPQRPPEWQVFQTERWDHEYQLLNKPIVIVDWGAVFSYGEPFEYKGAIIKPEKEASDEAAQFVTDAFDQTYIVGLFLCKLLGDHRNDANFFQDRATRTYLKGDATPYPYRTEKLKQANLEAQRRVLKAALGP